MNNFPCKNIAYYKAGEFYCFDEGLTGAIHDVYNIDGEIHVAGHLEHNDNIYPLARFEGTTWSYTTIPGREDATGTIVLTGGLDHSKEVAINHASIPGKQELWYKMDDGSWQKQITVNGVILAAGASSYGSIYAGHFDSVTIHRDGFEDSVIIANNVVIRENYPDNYYSIGQEISDTVLVIKAIGSAIYFGGICSSEAAKSNVCLTRYLGETLQPLIISDTFIGSTTNSIHAIELYNETDLILSGEFEMSEYFGTYGSNLATYDLVYNSINAIGDFNKKVTGLAELLDGWYIGGHFTINNTSLETLPHLAKIVSSDFISEISNDDLLIYPNPTDNILNINMKYNSNIEKLYIVDLMGRNLIQLNNYTQPLSIDISGLANGLYILVIESSDKEKFYKSFEVN
ncbi:MAG: T9SS type A sorting domain-containing protein [Fimbriimonadaceae bacterium]|nr:T9SS type A sorting domain-containing protein [Chitinophagales bacterium]